jgi:predicted RND superfamily exporter protein
VAEQEIYNEKNKIEISEIITVGQTLNNSKEPAFNGEIQNLQIFNYALPDDSVKRLFQGEEINKPVSRKEQKASTKIEVFRSVPVKK